MPTKQEADKERQDQSMEMIRSLMQMIKDLSDDHRKERAEKEARDTKYKFLKWFVVTIVAGSSLLNLFSGETWLELFWL